MCFHSLSHMCLRRKEHLEPSNLVSCLLVPSRTTHLFLNSCFLWLLEQSWIAWSRIDHCFVWRWHISSTTSADKQCLDAVVGLGMHVYSPSICHCVFESQLVEAHIGKAWLSHCFTTPWVTSLAFQVRSTFLAQTSSFCPPVIDSSSIWIYPSCPECRACAFNHSGTGQLQGPCLAVLMHWLIHLELCLGRVTPPPTHTHSNLDIPKLYQITYTFTSAQNGT